MFDFNSPTFADWNERKVSVPFTNYLWSDVIINNSSNSLVVLKINWEYIVVWNTTYRILLYLISTPWVVQHIDDIIVNWLSNHDDVNWIEEASVRTSIRRWNKKLNSNTSTLRIEKVTWKWYFIWEWLWSRLLKKWELEIFKNWNLYTIFTPDLGLISMELPLTQSIFFSNLLITSSKPNVRWTVDTLRKSLIKKWIDKIIQIKNVQEWYYRLEILSWRQCADTNDSVVRILNTN